MPEPRYRQISLDDTPYYHCISRCVRRAYLCGFDAQSGYNFEHRRDWIVSRIRFLCSVFAVDLCAYAIMSNHYHIVVRINATEAEGWSNEEVAKRWTQIFSCPESVGQYLSNTSFSKSRLKHVTGLLVNWRQRLCNLSWFMRCLNEPIARMANNEDKCSGRFWEGRFKSQALLDERALLACMAYVDLNPIRAAMARTPEDSNYTSVKERIHEAGNTMLMPFSEKEPDVLPYDLKDYLELVEWAGREIKREKAGYIPAHAPPILTRLRMGTKPVLSYLSQNEPPLFGALGPVSMLREFAISVGKRFIKGHNFSKQLCPENP